MLNTEKVGLSHRVWHFLSGMKLRSAEAHENVISMSYELSALWKPFQFGSGDG